MRLCRAPFADLRPYALQSLFLRPPQAAQLSSCHVLRTRDNRNVFAIAVRVMLQLRGQQPFRSAAQACTLGTGCTGIYVLSPQHLRFARACFGISGLTVICGALKSASIAQGLLPPAHLAPVTEALPVRPLLN